MWSALAIVALVLLRLGIGWHFYKEGSEKVQSGKFSSTGFLSNAKGPLAGLYKSMLRDPDGYARLNEEQALEAWDRFKERAARHYGFDDEQRAFAEKIFDRRKDELEFFFSNHSDEIDVYFKSLVSKQQDLSHSERREVASLKSQVGKKAVADMPPEPGPWYAQLEALWRAYEQDLNDLATEDQAARRPLALPRPGATVLGVDQVDVVLPYFDFCIGVCLILGLFTRVASVAAALFLCSVIASQWPGAADAAPVYPQLVEMLALLVLAATGAGRYAGLDCLFSRLFCKRCAPAGNSI